MEDGDARPDAEHDAVLACPERHQVVVAPPGTGKTLRLGPLGGALADELAPHARVLLLTFSRQARGQLEREAARQLAAGSCAPASRSPTTTGCAGRRCRPIAGCSACPTCSTSARASVAQPR